MLLLTLLLACGPDLPSGWEGATPIADFTQQECSGEDAYSGDPAVVSATVSDGSVSIVYDHAVFRCAQDVEGFYKPGSDGAYDVLVQPIDMNPTEVAGCDCVYRIDAVLPVTATTVNVYKRQDNMNDPNGPSLDGTATVQ